jgi:hypothetical protein
MLAPLEQMDCAMTPRLDARVDLPSMQAEVYGSLEFELDENLYVWIVQTGDMGI